MIQERTGNQEVQLSDQVIEPRCSVEEHSMSSLPLTPLPLPQHTHTLQIRETPYSVLHTIGALFLLVE